MNIDLNINYDSKKKIGCFLICIWHANVGIKIVSLKLILKINIKYSNEAEKKNNVKHHKITMSMHFSLTESGYVLCDVTTTLNTNTVTQHKIELQL